MARVSFLTSQAQTQFTKYQEGNGYLNDVRLESYGFFLADYVIRGAELTQDAINPKKLIIGEGIINLKDELFRVFTEDFTASKKDASYYVGFVFADGFVMSTSEPSEDYIRLWTFETDANGTLGNFVDHRGPLGRVRYKAAYDSVYLNTTEVQEAIQLSIDTAAELNILLGDTTYIGDFNVDTQYKKNNIISFGGSSYIAKQPTKGAFPPALPVTNNAFWGLFGRKGMDGTGATVIHRDKFTAIAGQTLFTLTNNYDQIQNRITVYVEELVGAELVFVPKFAPEDLMETSVNSYTLNTPCTEGQKVIAEYFSEAPVLAPNIQDQINMLHEIIQYNNIDEVQALVEALMLENTGQIDQKLLGIDDKWALKELSIDQKLLTAQQTIDQQIDLIDITEAQVDQKIEDALAAGGGKVIIPVYTVDPQAPVIGEMWIVNDGGGV
jgi:hypothetical protein